MATALFVLAAVVFSRQRASRVAVLFCAMIVLVAVWFASFALMFLSRDAAVAAHWGRLGLAGVALLPASIYDFTTTALRLRSRRRNVVHLVWAVAIVFAVVAVAGRAIVWDVAPHPWGFYPAAGYLLAYVSPASELHVVFLDGSSDTVIAQNVAAAWALKSKTNLSWWR